MNAIRLKALFNELSAALVLYARQWCDSPDDAVQEAFIDLARTTQTLKCPKAWLYTTTRRKAQNLARTEQRQRHHLQQAANEKRAEMDEYDYWFGASSATLVPDDVQRALGSLDGDSREIIVARVWGELSFEQLAVLLECSVSSAYRRYQGALAELRQILSPEITGSSRHAMKHSELSSRYQIDDAVGKGEI